MHIFKGVDLFGRGQFGFLSACFMKKRYPSPTCICIAVFTSPPSDCSITFNTMTPLLWCWTLCTERIYWRYYLQIRFLTLRLTCITFVPHPLLSSQFPEIYCHLLQTHLQTQEFSAHPVSKYTNPTLNTPSNSSEFNILRSSGKNIQELPIFESLSAK